MKEITAVCPGSFDPVTIGHLDIIRRASKMFDHVIVVVMSNRSKTGGCFSYTERVALLQTATEEIENVSIEYYDGLLAEYCKIKNAKAIVKGLRAMSDFEYEFQMALTNHKLNPEIETVFLTTSAENMYLSSSMVKQVGSMGGDIRDFIPAKIYGQVIERLLKRKDVTK